MLLSLRSLLYAFAQNIIETLAEGISMHYNRRATTVHKLIVCERATRCGINGHFFSFATYILTAKLTAIYALVAGVAIERRKECVCRSSQAIGEKTEYISGSVDGPAASGSAHCASEVV